MVTVRVQRHAVEALAEAPATAGVFRQELEAAFDDSGTPTVRVQRQGIEVLAKAPATARNFRQEIEAAFDDAGTPTARVQRQGVEVLAKTPAKVGVFRQEAEAAFDDAGTPPVRVQRQGIEILARVGVPPPTPLAYPAGLDLFLHNWANELRLETSYLTDVTRSPSTLAEERRALLERPGRLLSVRWTRGERDELDRLLVTLRRFTKANLKVPLYMDAVLISGDSPTLQTEITCDPRFRRYFNGAQVAVIPVGKTFLQPVDIDLYTLAKVLPDRLETTLNLSQLYTAGDFLVVPLIDLELELQPGVTFLNDDTADVTLELAEIIGKSALPPSFTGGVPDGWNTQLGLPVFEIAPNWANGVRAAYRRYGQTRREGRKDVRIPDGPRYVQEQQHDLLLDRPDFWRVLQFFDSRRGRMGAFWEIDQEALWTVTDTDPQFIDVSPFGDFNDFVADFTEHAGIVMEDGTVHIREINTIQDVTGSWRLSLVQGNDLPAIDVSQIARFSRARIKRFQSDALEERWSTTDTVRISLLTVEVLNEKEIDLL